MYVDSENLQVGQTSPGGIYGSAGGISSSAPSLGHYAVCEWLNSKYDCLTTGDQKHGWEPLLHYIFSSFNGVNDIFIIKYS